MAKKYLRPLIVGSALAVILVGCSNSKDTAPAKTSNQSTQTTQANTQSKGVNTNKITFNPSNYYKLSDDTALVTVNGQKLTVGDLKEQAFNQLLVSDVNQFVEKQLLMKKYPVSDDELNTELKKFGNNVAIDKEQVRFQLAYDKAVRDGITVTEADLKQIYEKNFKNSGRSYDSMLPELKKMAPYYLNNNVNSKLATMKNNSDIQYNDAQLKQQINTMFAATTAQQGTQKTN